MKRRISTILMTLVLLLVPVAVVAQDGPYNSAFQVQNLSDIADAHITIHYVAEDGTRTVQQAVVPKGESLTFFDGTMQAPPNFKGSVDIFSDQPIATTANFLRADFRALASYNGFNASDAGTQFRLPLLQKDNQGYNSYIAVQNMGSSPATVRIEYLPSPEPNSGSETNEVISNIPVGGSRFIRQDQTPGLGARFVGSATVVSTNGVPFVVTVGQELNGRTNDQARSNGQILMYNGFRSGSSSVLLPLIMANNSGFFTGVSVQNVGSSNTDITIEFTPNTADTNKCASGIPAKRTFPSVPPNATRIYLQYSGAGGDPNLRFGCRYIGSAKITNSANQQLTAIVNELGGPFASAYEGFDPAKATTKSRAPLVMSRNNGYYAGIQIQNAGPQTTATIHFSPNVAPDDVTDKCQDGNIKDIVMVIPANDSRKVILEPYDRLARDHGFSGCTYVGSATASTADGGRIIMIVNVVRNTGDTGDQFLTYTGTNE